MLGLIVLLQLCLLIWATPSCAHDDPPRSAPIWVYNNWSAYDELSDEIPLDEALAMRELDELLRLRHNGVRFDYYMMDAFWFDPDGGYRKWRADSWPEGPDRWIATCLANGIKPGLWFGTNSLSHLHAAPQWRNSLDKIDNAMAMYSGGFLADFMAVLDYWYDRGIRMFKFDFADFDVAAKGDEGRLTPDEIRRRNVQAFHAALQAFRRKHPNVVLVGFNGIVGNVDSARAPVSPRMARWLDVFDTLYSGDPRPSYVPEMDFWRSMDIYSDQMVRSLEAGGIPLRRIDSTSFMIGDTGTNYHRRIGAWRGSLLLMLAHGGSIDTVHGNLEFLNDDQARWLAKAQAIFGALQRDGTTKSFGAAPGVSEPYGFASVAKAGALIMVVNPAQSMRTIPLPALSPQQEGERGGRVLFRDAGFAPVLDNSSVRLGPGQIALVGFGRYNDAAYDLGVEPVIRIPRSIESLPAQFGQVAEPAMAKAATPPTIEAVVTPPAQGDIRIVMRQRDADGALVRSNSRTSMGKFFVVSAEQSGHALPVHINYDKVIWSGLSWAVGEIPHALMAPGRPVRIRLSSADNDASLRLEGKLYVVEYGDQP